MRYLLHFERDGEAAVRMDFLFDVFHLWFVKKEEIGRFSVYESFPFIRDDIIMLYGHNYEIEEIFRFNPRQLYEKNVFIISCSTKRNGVFSIAKKNVFFAPQRMGRALIRNGAEYGFDFDPTDAELLLWKKRRKNIWDNLTSVFERIQ